MWWWGEGVRGNVHARHPVSAAAAAISGPRKWERIEVFRLPIVVSSARLSLPFSSSSRRTAPVIGLHTSRRRLFTRLRFKIALSRIIRTGPISMGRCADCTAGVFPLRVQKPAVSAPTGVRRFFAHVTLSKGGGGRTHYVRHVVSSLRFPETCQRSVKPAAKAERVLQCFHGNSKFCSVKCFHNQCADRRGTVKQRAIGVIKYF